MQPSGTQITDGSKEGQTQQTHLSVLVAKIKLDGLSGPFPGWYYTQTSLVAFGGHPKHHGGSWHPFYLSGRYLRSHFTLLATAFFSSDYFPVPPYQPSFLPSGRFLATPTPQPQFGPNMSQRPAQSCTHVNGLLLHELILVVFFELFWDSNALL